MRYSKLPEVPENLTPHRGLFSKVVRCSRGNVTCLCLVGVAIWVILAPLSYKYILSDGPAQRHPDVEPSWSQFMSGDLEPRLIKIKNSQILANKYKVPNTVDFGVKMTKYELMCKLQGILDAFITKRDRPFMHSNWSYYLPFGSMVFDKIRAKTTCAVVSSAASMRASNFGEDIDSHDLIMRFNDAPTKGYELDVGSKTSIRLFNSQVFTRRKEFFFTNMKGLGDQFVIWDPTTYNVNLTEWYSNPEYKFFDNFRQWVDKMQGQEAFILNPNFIWKVWTVIQAFSAERIQPNPPSSGTIGLALLMNICKKIDLYGFLSLKGIELCHYYDSMKDTACTYGAYHPLIFEKKAMAFIAQSSYITDHKDRLTIVPNDQIACLKPQRVTPSGGLSKILQRIFMGR